MNTLPVVPRPYSPPGGRRHRRYAEQLSRIAAHQCTVCHRPDDTLWCDEHLLWACSVHWPIHTRIAHTEER